MSHLTKHLLLPALLLCLAQAQLRAQRPDFYLNLDGIMDNREYFMPYGIHQTYFGIRINPGVSFAFDSIHEIGAGINYMYEFGGAFMGVKPQLDLYYAYHGEQVEFKLGSFRRSEVMEYPRYLLRDSLTYYRPNMEGASVAYSWEWGHVHAWVDWMGREDTVTREAIFAGIDARLGRGIPYLEFYTTRYHLAKTTVPGDGFRIHDDGSLLLMAGADLDERLFLDELDLSTGLAASHVQERPEDNQWFTGWLSRFHARYRFTGIRANYYIGDSSPLTWGDPLYDAKNYARFDFYVDPFRKNSRISSKISWNLHLIPGEGLYHSQQFLLSVRL